jgi:hypothetical protein
MNKSKKMLLILGIISLSVANKINAQAYFNGSIAEASSGVKLKNAKIMVINNRDTSFFNVGDDGKYNITTKEGKNRIFALADGYITELNSIDAAKGSVNSVNISMVPKNKVDMDMRKRDKFKAESAPSMAIRGIDEMTDDDVSEGYAKKPHGFIGDKVVGTKRLSMPGMPVATQGAAGKLTAGSILDFGKWKMWNDLNEGVFKQYSSQCKSYLNASKRYVVQISNGDGVPVVDVPVVLKSKETVVWRARTDNTGKAELWANPNTLEAAQGSLSAEVTAYGKMQTITKLKPFEKGINFIMANGPCSMADQLDVAFVVDATGSMGDEINYLKLDLDTFIKTISMRNKDINLRLGSVFYRDQGDEYVYRVSPFSSNTTVTDNFILDQRANGGGDYPEALEQAMREAVEHLDWSSTARARIIFLMLDAPCHYDASIIDSLNKYIARAAEKGIRVVPVACSGTDKSTEFMLRSMALLTNGKYLFLTNHSGVGNAHMEPSTDIYAVRSLLDEMLAVTSEFSTVPDCQQYLNANAIKHVDSLRMTENPFGTSDSSRYLVLHAKDSAAIRDSLIIRERGKYGAISWVKIWPNPTEGPLSIKIEADIREVFIADIGGKLLQRFSCKRGDELHPDLGSYSSGIYFVKYPTANGWVAERIVLRR